MANSKNEVKIQFSTTITLNETEVRALDALVGYGDDSFIKAFKEKLGSYYIENYESGLRSFFETVRSQVLPSLRAINAARKKLEIEVR